MESVALPTRICRGKYVVHHYRGCSPDWNQAPPDTDPNGSLIGNFWEDRCEDSDTFIVVGHDWTDDKRILKIITPLVKEDKMAPMCRDRMWGQDAKPFWDEAKRTLPRCRCSGRCPDQGEEPTDCSCDADDAHMAYFEANFRPNSPSDPSMLYTIEEIDLNKEWCKIDLYGDDPTLALYHQ